MCVSVFEKERMRESMCSCVFVCVSGVRESKNERGALIVSEKLFKDVEVLIVLIFLWRCSHFW